MATRVAGKRSANRWPYLGASQRKLLLAGIGVWLGTAAPWAVIIGKPLWGAPLAVSWTLWAGLMVLAGASVRWRAVAALSGAAGGGTALYFAVWQVTRLADTCLSSQCLPGPGVVLLVAGGATAVFHSVALFRARATA